MSFTSVDFPEPLTPVTATKALSGIATSISFRLFSFAPLTTNWRLGSIARLFAGIGIDFLPDRYAPVMDSFESIRD
ncbi:unannotated protein [freshwater metagenome]|uniref:Unannotated protein n=1 Tax=freshwater metagenome TaxID=449393 RepID=A0A6J7PZF5_9ZZZZ